MRLKYKSVGGSVRSQTRQGMAGLGVSWLDRASQGVVLGRRGPTPKWLKSGILRSAVHSAEKGESMAEVGQKYGISRQRVYQILVRTGLLGRFKELKAKSRARRIH